MGSELGKLDVPKTSSNLRQSQSRINIHRGKKLNSIAKKKDDIAKHLEAGNEVNAKIWVETLINEEGMIPCYDVVSIMCDQVQGRVKSMQKFGPPKDMDITFHTIIYASERMEVDELLVIRKQLQQFLGKQFVEQSLTDESCVHKVVVKNINFRIIEEGEQIKRLIEIAKERNINYIPSNESMAAYQAYMDRIYIQNVDKPLDQIQNVGMQQPPLYNPMQNPAQQNLYNQNPYNQQNMMQQQNMMGQQYQYPPQQFNQQDPYQYQGQPQLNQQQVVGYIDPQNISQNFGKDINLDVNANDQVNKMNNIDPIEQMEMQKGQNQNLDQNQFDDLEERLKNLKK